MKRRKFLALAGSAALGLAGVRRGYAADRSLPSADERQVFLQVARPRQTIEHFGASDCWTIEAAGSIWEREPQERLADLLFSRDKGIGLSLWRFNLGAGDPLPDGYWDPCRRVETLQSAANAPIDAKRQIGQQWFLKAAKKRGVEKTLAFVNSPPAWLTSNGRAFESKDNSGTNLKAGSENAFGKYLADILHYFERTGLPFDYVSPANEPNWRWTGGQEGCSYNIGEMRRMVLAVADELRAAKVTARIRLGEMGDYRALLDDADYRAYRGVTGTAVTFGGNAPGGQPGAAYGYLQGLFAQDSLLTTVDGCFLSHAYWTDGSPRDLSLLRKAVRANFERYAPGGTLWQSEYCLMEHTRDLGMGMALRVASVIHHDLTCAEVSSWSWWTALAKGDYKDGLIYTDISPDGKAAQNVLPSKTLWTLGNWSRFVRPGAQRIETLSDAFPDELLASAYLSADKREIVVVLVNPGATTLPVRLGADCSVREWKPWVTDATRDLHLEKTIPISDAIPVPAQSVITLVGETGGPLNAMEIPLSVSPPQRERATGSYLYAVSCGRSDTDRTTDARRNSRADMVYGSDPGTGFQWGYLTYGGSGGHTIDNSNSTVRVEEGDTPGQGITYRFEVEPNTAYTLDLEWIDPWNNPDRKMTVTVQGEVVETSLLPGKEQVKRRYTATGSPEGNLEIQVTRTRDNAAPNGDPLLASIRIQPLVSPVANGA